LRRRGHGRAAVHFLVSNVSDTISIVRFRALRRYVIGGAQS